MKMTSVTLVSILSQQEARSSAFEVSVFIKKT